MAVTVVSAAPSRLLTTPDRVRAALDSDEDDARLISRIRAATALVEGFCGRTFGRERVLETAAGVGLRILALSRTPVITIHALNVGDVARDYTLTDARAGLILVAHGHEDMWLALGGPRLYDTPTRPHTYAVEYTGGYVLPGWPDDPDTGMPPESTLPAEVEHAVIETVRGMIDYAAGEGDVQSERLGDYQVTYRGSRGGNTSLSPDLAMMLEPHKAVVL